jgi:GNAT superfamily N-acetyltransferase
MLPQVLDVLSFLWTKDAKVREDYFNWKYRDNPHSKDPLGIVALHKGRIIGFRGYLATRFEIPDRTKDLIVLVAGDTCVHPDFRHKGLSVRMGNMAVDAFADRYKFLLNLTTTAPSLPGYLKLGFHPITKKAYLSQYTFPGFFRYLWAYHKHLPVENQRTSLGTSGPVIVSDRPKPEVMAGICAEVNTLNPNIRLLRDEMFFRWRFLNPFNTYRFYYLSQNSEITGYVVIGFSPNYQRGYVLDFADTDGKSVTYLLKHMIQNKHFDILSVYHFSFSEEERIRINDLGFRAKGFVRSLERRKTGELPVLIRPVRKGYTESDWKIEGIDVRRIENWRMTEICSDSV